MVIIYKHRAKFHAKHGVIKPFSRNAFFSAFLKCLLLIFTLSSALLYASGLPAKHEAARLMLAVEAAVSAENWSRAEASLVSLNALDIDLPPAHFYYSGLVNKQNAKLDEAKKDLESYVVAAGAEAEHYRVALELLTEIEVLQASAAEDNAAKQSASTPDSTAANKGAESAGLNAALSSALSAQSESRAYIESLKSLYLTKNAKNALLAQANSLLNAHAYTGSRIQTRTGREGLRYSLTVRGSSLQVQRKDYRAGQPTLSVDRFSVLGVDPFINSRCSQAEQACWLFHPGDQHTRWLVIENDNNAREELVKAVSLLIRQMQAG